MGVGGYVWMLDVGVCVVILTGKYNHNTLLNVPMCVVDDILYKHSITTSFLKMVIFIFQKEPFRWLVGCI